jgi:SagB-type dehydrogenase family enzyme
MKKLLRLLIVLSVCSFFYISFLSVAGGEKAMNENGKIILPGPRYKSNISVEEAILKRRSVRNYSDKPLTLKELSQLLWSAQGITERVRKFRAAPSAGALYPLEAYIVVGDVSSLESGIYKYNTSKHEISKTKEGDFRNELSLASLGQSCVKEAPVSIIFAAVYDRITKKYGERGIVYTYMEAGHAAQNIYLQAEALNLGTVVVGAFTDDKVKNVIGMKEEETPLYILPIGKK